MHLWVHGILLKVSKTSLKLLLTLSLVVEKNDQLGVFLPHHSSVFHSEKEGERITMEIIRFPQIPQNRYTSSHPTPPPDSPRLPCSSIQSNESQNLITNPQRIIPRVAVTSSWNIHCNFLSVTQVAIGVGEGNSGISLPNKQVLWTRHGNAET